ncbi:unnamed protein product [Lymnaea stagnalis]|uniref:Kazal-like domain-containing protein n=1 Tax=Lymnaea stagnalis TaxID=6523 RepID=A0AAV2H0W9_LYMST
MSDQEHQPIPAGQESKASTGDQARGQENPTFSCALDDEGNVDPPKPINDVDPPKPTNVPKIEDEDPLDLRFGFWKFKSEMMGRLLSKLYVFSLMTGAVAMLSVAGLKIINMYMTALQTQFHLQDVTKEDFTRAHSIGVFISCLLCGYLGSFGKINIPVWIGIASFLSGVAMMAPALVHLASPYHLTIDHTTKDFFYKPFLCTGPVNMTQLPSAPPRDDMVYAIFMMAHVVCGLLLPVVSVLAPIYIDNNCVDKRRLGLFLGIFVILSELAPISAIGGGGFFGQFAVDLKETELNVLDPRFVPAWWLPVLLYGAFMCLISYNIAGFPTRLVPKRQQKMALVKAAQLYFGEGEGFIHNGESKNISSSRTENLYTELQDMAHTEVKETETQPTVPVQTVTETSDRVSLQGSIVFKSLAWPRYGIVSGIKDIPFQLVRVIVNPALTLFLVVMVITAVPLRGSDGIKQPFLIFEYGVSVTTSGFGTIPSMVSNIAGLIISAIICTRVTSLRGYALLILASYFLCSVFASFYFAMGCTNDVIFGLESSFGSPLPNVTSQCGCQSFLPYPTCGDDGHTYLSPCYAGCTAGDGFTFKNCSHLSTDQHGSEAKFAACPPGCMDKFIGFVVCFTLVTMFGQMTVLPRSIMVLRMLEPRDRSWGLSLALLVYFLASISTQRWSQEILDSEGCLASASGVCVLYNRPAISHLMSSVDLCVYVTLLVTALVIYGVFHFKVLKLNTKR